MIKGFLSARMPENPKKIRKFEKPNQFVNLLNPFCSLFTMNSFQKILFLALPLTAVCNTSKADTPVWIEADSAAAIKSRLLSDFRITWPEAVEIFKDKYGIDEATLEDWAAKKYVEVKTIDGERRMHRKSPGNAKLLNPELNGGWKFRGSTASPARIAYVDSVLAWYDGKNPNGVAHSVNYTFEIEVPYNEALEGDTLRVWMPIPFESGRQTAPKILSSTHPYILSGDKSMHSTVYMTQPVVKDSVTRFSYTAEFITRGQYFHPDSILANLKPYDVNSAEYKRYTSPEAPHVIEAKELAKSIVGDETNPFKQSELVYDYIIHKYPWAGAREYSTITCIPEYVIREGHGDCGQVSLLYISLMRSLGVPARWESGWMLHPRERNLHDWAEVYFEGIGWVPVDVSFGRYTAATDPRAVTFYSKGMDAHRFAANHGVSGEMYPRKRFVRSETVDAQLGEVESTRGNLFYPGWSMSMKLNDVHPVEIVK